jgi:hypothetical protein
MDGLSIVNHAATQITAMAIFSATSDQGEPDGRTLPGILLHLRFFSDQYRAD